MVYEKSSFWIESDRTAPIAIKSAGGIREDGKYGRIVTTSSGDITSGFSPFWILPASFTKEIMTDVELKKLVVKPPVFNILVFYKVEPNMDDDQVYLEGYMKPTSYKVVDGGESYVFLNIKLRNQPLLGAEGRLFVTKRRKLVVSFEDFDGQGVFIPAGSKLDIEIMVLDVSAVRALKSINSQNLMAPSLFVPKEIEEKVDNHDLEYFKTPELPNGYINTASPTFLYTVLAKDYDGKSLYGEKVNFGEDVYPVDLIWLGFYRKRRKCLIGV